MEASPHFDAPLLKSDTSDFNPETIKVAEQYAKRAEDANQRREHADILLQKLTAFTDLMVVKSRSTPLH